MICDRELAAVKRWVATFTPVQTKIIVKLMKYEPELWHEVTMPFVWKRVVLNGTDCKGLITDIDGDIFTIKLDESKAIFKTRADEFTLYFEELMLTWPIMWSFSDARDISWLENGDGIFEMSQWGFRIFKHDELGYYFGVKKVKFDFYTDYWIPLYDSRGLDWHVRD